MGTRADEYEHARVALQLATITIDGRRRRSAPLLAEPLAHRRSALRARRQDRLTRSWEHFGPVNDVKIRGREPGRRRPSWSRSPASTGSPPTRSSRSRRSRPERDGRHRHGARSHHPRGRARPDRRAQPRRPRLHDRHGGDARSATPASTRRTRLHRADPERPARTRRRRRSAATASPASSPTAASSRPGPTAPSTTSTSSRSRRRTSASTSTTPRPARTSSSTTTGPRGTSTRSPSCRAPSRRSSRTIQGSQMATGPGQHRFVQHHPDEPRTRPWTARSSTTPPSATRSTRGGRGARHRGLLERGGAGRDDVRSHDVRGRRASSARRRSSTTAAGSPTCRPTSRCTSSRSTSSACRSAISRPLDPDACPTRIGAAPAATSRAPASGVLALGQNPTVAEQHGPQPYDRDPLATRIANGEYRWNTSVQPILGFSNPANGGPGSASRATTLRRRATTRSSAPTRSRA